MGVRLIREVLADAPDGLPPLCRLVLLVIAENARDSTRRGFPGMAELCRRTGLSESAVGGVFRDLAAWNLDVRVRIGTDKTGRPVYAARGHRTTYALPRIADGKEPERSHEAQTFPKRKVPHVEDLSGEKGPTRDTERSHETPRKVPDVWGPSRQGPTVPIPSIPSKNYGGGAQRSTHYARTGDVGDEPPPRCPEHIDEPADGPCRGCGTARKAHEAWATERRRADAAAASRRAQDRAAAVRAAIDACDMCDHTGYRAVGAVTALCSHDRNTATRTHNGAAAARAALNRRTT